MNCFNTLIFIITLLAGGVAQASAAESRLQFISNGVTDLVKNAKPGDTVFVPPGGYIDNVTVPPGVSLVGKDPRNTVIMGDIRMSALPNHPVRLSRITLIHTGDRSSPALWLKGHSLRVQHCLLISEGGFSTITVSGNSSALIRNNIIVGPVGDYAIFGRGKAKIEVINSTIMVQGFGIGLMDNSYATVRNCLFNCRQKPAMIRTGSDYSISYCNISPGSGSFYHNHDLINGDVTLRDKWNHPSDATPPEVSNRDDPKYDSVGLTFHKQEFNKQEFTKSRSIDELRKQVPDFARHAGSPEPTHNNPDGTRNTLGAFGGPLGNLWY